MPGQQLTQRRQGNRWVWERFKVSVSSYHDTKNSSRIHKEEKNKAPINVQGRNMLWVFHVQPNPLIHQSFLFIGRNVRIHIYLIITK